MRRIKTLDDLKASELQYHKSMPSRKRRSLRTRIDQAYKMVIRDWRDHYSEEEDIQVNEKIYSL